MKHLWTLDGKKFNFCVKCGRFRDETRGDQCPMTAQAAKQKHPHTVGSDGICKKCNLQRFKIYYYPTKTNRLEHLGIKTSANASVRNSKYPFIEIHCIMGTTDWMIKDVIE